MRHTPRPFANESELIATVNLYWRVSSYLQSRA